MRYSLILLSLVLVAEAVTGQIITSPQRFGIEQDFAKYPQQTPHQAMQSVARLLLEGRTDYLAAHLIDPVFVESKVKEYAKLYQGPEQAVELVAFHHLVKQMESHFRQDPTIKEELRRFAKEIKEDDWKMDDAKGQASAQLPDLTSRQVYFVESKGRWYLQNQR